MPQIQQSQRSKKTVSEIAHQIANKMTGVGLAAEFLLGSNLTPDQKAYAQALFDATREVGALTQELTDLTTAEKTEHHRDLENYMEATLAASDARARRELHQ